MSDDSTERDRAANAGELGRRGFLRALGLAAGGTVLSRGMMACAPAAANGGAAASASGSAAAPLGIQLYSLRSILPKDLDGTFAALAAIGYREVEPAGFHGRTAREFRAALDRAGLRAPTMHVPLADVRDQRARVLEDAAALDCGTIVVPWLDEADRTAEGYRRLADTLQRAGQDARAAGRRVGYHNHDFELAKLGDRTALDFLLGATDPALVDFEMDLFWVTKAGGSPLDFFARHPGRFKAVHVKDMTASGEMVNVGAGTIDFARIHERRAQAGIEHWIVEHDNPADPLAFARASYASLRGIIA